ncbi:hypothetical protein Q8W16_03845 [Photobacterium damselae subsp. piscicida]|nr:hypothetical protein [Photobacterium damselae subsp. piscicida]MDP2567810.1 hypothetical protein [Photobacterium damselae subsp. piscicida]
MKHGLEKMGDYVNSNKSSKQNELPLGSDENKVEIGFNLVVDADVYEHYQDLVQEIAKI